MKAAATVKPVIPANWLSLLELATQEVFEAMLACRPRRFQGAEAGHDLTAIVGLAGKLCGTLTLRCTRKSASLMTFHMLGVSDGEDNPQIDEHLWDAVGEVCNMIAGNFKNKLPGLTDHCLLSVPTVIAGRDYKLHPRSHCSSLEIVFEFAGEPFAVTLDVHT